MGASGNSRKQTVRLCTKLLRHTVARKRRALLAYQLSPSNSICSKRVMFPQAQLSFLGSTSDDLGRITAQYRCASCRQYSDSYRYHKARVKALVFSGPSRGHIVLLATALTKTSFTYDLRPADRPSRHGDL